jgi:hypothetical protein
LGRVPSDHTGTLPRGVVFLSSCLPRNSVKVNFFPETGDLLVHLREILFGLGQGDPQF